VLTLCCAAAALADDAGNLEPGWREAVLELTVNGAPSGNDFVVLRDAGGALWLAESDFARLRLRVPRVSPHLTDAKRYFPLAAVSGVKVSYDDARAAASITAPPAAFESTNVNFAGGQRPPLSHGASGAFLNYDISGQRGQYSAANVASLYTELGVFSPAGVFTNTAVGMATQGTDTLVRLETTFTHDFPDSLQTLRFGDTISVPGSWGQAVRFGGLQWGSNYGIRPDLVTTPLLAASGAAVVPSTVEVFVNGKTVGVSEVPPGPFVVNQVPALTGSGEVNIVVRNALGQAQVISLPFYSAAVMLQPGLSLYDIDVGALRENFGLKSNDYGPLLGSATWRHGLTSTLTGEIHVEAMHQGPYAAGVDLAQAIDHWAVITADLAVGGQPANSGLVVNPGLTATAGPVANAPLPPGPGLPGPFAQTASSGTYEALGIQHVEQRLSFVLQAQHASLGFRDIGDVGGMPQPTQRFLAQAGWNMGRMGSLQAAFVSEKNYNDVHQQVVGLTYQVSAGRGNFSVSASRTTGDTQDNNLYLFYTLPLDSRRNTSTSVRYDSQQPEPKAALVQTLQRTLPLGAGDGYLLAAGTDGSYNAEYTRRTDALTVDLAAARYLDSSAQRLTVDGGLILLGGELRAIRTVYDSFAMVDVGGIPNMTVYFNNQPVGRTDDNGLALVPNVLSFQVNRVSIDPLQLPLDATTSDTQMQFVPPYRSGTIVHFPVKRVRPGVFKLRRMDGSVVPAGAVVRFLGEEFPVGLEGLTYITNYDHGTTGEAHWTGGHCKFRLPAPPSDQPQPDMGIIACRSAP
jgi:outer membrane usher protein